jgi:hypothetical protein
VAQRLAPAQRQAAPACGGGRVSGGRQCGAAYWRGGEARQLRNDDGGFRQELLAGEFYVCACGRRVPPMMANGSTTPGDKVTDRWAPRISGILI